MRGLLVTNKQNTTRKAVKPVIDNSNVSCDGCGKVIDMYYCSRTFANGRWYFYCKECEKNGVWAKAGKEKKKHY